MSDLPTDEGSPPLNIGDDLALEDANYDTGPVLTNNHVHDNDDERISFRNIRILDDVWESRLQDPGGTKETMPAKTYLGK